MVSHTNLKDESKLVVNDPAPQPGDSLHYHTFLEDAPPSVPKSVRHVSKERSNRGTAST